MIGFSFYAAMGVRAGRLTCIRPVPPSNRWATGSGLTAWGWSSTGSTRASRHPAPRRGVRIGTDDDDLRASYLARGLENVHDALERGIDVRGLFHWTAVDNYEWLHGYDVRFGLMDRDRGTVRPSARVLAREAVP